MRDALTANTIRKFFLTCWLLVSGMLLSSCGGGGIATLISGVGSGGTGLVEGLVVGFGSVFIDGTEYATTTATIEQDNAQGQPQIALLKLGQRVRATLDSTGKLVVTALVIPSLSGPVTAAATQDGSGDWWARVAGQWVHIVSAATHTPLGLTTVIAGVNNPGTTPDAQLPAGSEVEVHGVWSWDLAHQSYVLVASRVEMLSYTPLASNILLGGVAAAVPGSGQLELNATYGGTVLQGTLPAGLQTGQYVSAWVTRAVWNAWAGGSAPLMAYSVSASGIASQVTSSTQKAQLSGLVSNYNPATNTATVQGTTVTLPSGTKVGDGDYIRLTGQVSAGVLAQTMVDDEKSSTAPVTPQSIQVLGTTNGINWSGGGTLVFVLQGTSISAAPDAYAASCASYAPLNTVSVTVTGLVPSPGQPVVASSVSCTLVSAPPSGSVSDFHGSIRSADSGSFTLANEDNLFTVTWAGNTYIDPNLGAPGSGWTGQRVEVMGTLTGSALTATVIRLDTGGTND